MAKRGRRRAAWCCSNISGEVRLVLNPKTKRFKVPEGSRRISKSFVCLAGQSSVCWKQRIGIER